MILSKKEIQSFFFVVISSFYALFLSLIPHEYFKDRANYFIHVLSAEDQLKFLALDIKSFFVEPGFILLNYFFGFFVSESFLIASYVFFIAFTCSFFVLRNSSNALMASLGMLLILFVPNLWSLQLGAIRQGLAASLIFWAYHFFKSNDVRFYAACFISGLIHIAGFLILALVLLDFFVKKYFPNVSPLKRGLFASFIFIFGWYLGGFVFGYLGDKHVVYLDKELNVSGALAVFYFVFLFLLYVKNNSIKYWSDFKSFAFIGVIVYVSIYFFIPIAGRFLDFFILPLIVVLVSKFTVRNFILILFYLFSNVFLFFNGGAEGVMNKFFW